MKVNYTIEEQNAFANVEKQNNGGGYHQPLIKGTFNDVPFMVDDTSCGDFGLRYSIDYDNKYLVVNQIDMIYHNDFTQDDYEFIKFIDTLGYHIVLEK